MEIDSAKGPAPTYAKEPGKNARCVAGWVAKQNPADEARAIKRAPNALAEMDAMHPELWKSWRDSRPSTMAACLKGLRAEEIAKLQMATDFDERCVVEAFASRPEHLAVLAGAGVDLAASRQSLCQGERVDVAIKLAQAGWGAPLSGMQKSGMSGAPEMTAALGDALDKTGKPRCALHLLAASDRWDSHCVIMEPGEARAALDWLCSASNQRARNGWGQDALAVAIDTGHGNTAAMLCSMGFDPRRKDAKGRDCFELLERRAKAMGIHGRGDKVRSLRAALPAMLAASERLDLAAVADFEAPSAAPKRRASL